MSIFHVGKLHFRYTQAIRRALRVELEREIGVRVADATFHYENVEGERAELRGRALMKDGALHNFFAVYTPDDGLQFVWTEYVGVQEKMNY